MDDGPRQILHSTEKAYVQYWRLAISKSYSQIQRVIYEQHEVALIISNGYSRENICGVCPVVFYLFTSLYLELFSWEKDLLPNRFADGRFQPFEYRWLESVYIPSRFRPNARVEYERKQDTGAIATALSKVKKFSLKIL